MNVKGSGLQINIDLNQMRRSMEAREKLRAQHADVAPTPTKNDFNPRRLINTRSDKGGILNVVA